MSQAGRRVGKPGAGVGVPSSPLCKGGVEVWTPHIHGVALSKALPISVWRGRWTQEFPRPLLPSALWDSVSWTHPGRRGWRRGPRGTGWQHQDTRRTKSILSHPPPCNLTDNVHISPNGSIITIVGTRPSNHGTYRCVASNAYGVAQSVVNLSVHGEGTLTLWGSALLFPALILSSEPPSLNPPSTTDSVLGILPV